MPKLSRLNALGVVAIVSALLFVSPGCDGGGGGGGSGYARYNTRLRACGVIGDGVVTPERAFDLTEDAQCVLNCQADASCSEIVALECGIDTSLITRCLDQCVGYFACTSGESIYDFYRCNGSDDCADASDEVGCGDQVFYCMSGVSLPLDYQCDDIQDCLDGEDEAGCALFSCESGATVPQNVVCDGRDDCADASDEVGCGDEVFHCDGGSTEPLRNQCNANLDCPGGEDEAGCAEFDPLVCF